MIRQGLSLILVAALTGCAASAEFDPKMGDGQARSAEQTLAERFAKGDIDETEYRARLEVLRANRPEM